MSRYLFLLFLTTLSISAFGNEALEKRARGIADQLRCPVCRGIPISESPAELAQDMMSIIQQKLNEGKTDREILAFFEDRYGEWILLNPKPEGINLVVWVLPIGLFLAGVFFITFKVLQWSKKPG